MTKTLFTAAALVALAATAAHAQPSDRMYTEAESAQWETISQMGDAETIGSMLKETIYTGSTPIPVLYGAGQKVAAPAAQDVVTIAVEEHKEAKKALKAAAKPMTAKEAYNALSAEQKAEVDARWEAARQAAIAEKKAKMAKMKAERERVEARMAMHKEKLPMTKRNCKDCKDGKECPHCKSCKDCMNGKKCDSCMHKKHGHKHHMKKHHDHGDKHNHHHSQDIPFADNPDFLQEAM